MNSLTQELKLQAHSLGFELSGVTAAAAPGRLQQFQDWLDAGYAADMQYLHERRQAYAHPSGVLEGCRSILMLGMPYVAGTESEEVAVGSGKVARYARGSVDYHDLLHDRLKRLKRWLLALKPEAKVRGVVDTAPLLEREFAETAGLGWVGKNTLLLNRELGSYFFLAALLTDLVLEADEPYSKGFCGTCRACLDSCPTDAFPKPFVLDANRCISYVTIEHRESIPEELGDSFQGWIFGCDICQEVCPWNRKIDSVPQAEFQAQLSTLSLREILELNEDQFRQRFRKLPMWRTRRRGLVRNAILLAVSQNAVDLLPQLQDLTDDPDELISDSANWGKQRLSRNGTGDHP